MTTASTAATRTAALRSAREKDSREKRDRALAALTALEAAAAPISFTAVANAAGVSRSLCYADGVRDEVEAARARQRGSGGAAVPTRAGNLPVTPESLRTDLAVAREEIRRLRGEEAALTRRLRLQLGAEIEGPEKSQLISRVAELETANRQLVAERDARTLETGAASRRITELEDELAAARESLRRTIREQNRKR